MTAEFGLRILRSGSYWVMRSTVWIVLLVCLIASLVVLGLQYWLLPNVNNYRGAIEASLSTATGQKVSIGKIEANWRGFRPQFGLFDLKVHESGGQQTLMLDRVDTVLSWRSIPQRNLVFELIEFAGSDVEIRRDSLGTIWIAGKAMARQQEGGRSGLLDWLARQEQVVIRGARLTWIDEMRDVPALIVEDVRLNLENSGSSHRFDLKGKPPIELASAVTVSGEFGSGESISDIWGWHGRLYADFEYANLVFAQQWVQLPAKLESGLGAMRVWLDVQDRGVHQTIAEADLINVSGSYSLGENGRKAFSLASLSGTARWNGDAEATVISLSGVTFETADGLRLTPTDLWLRRARDRGHETQLTISSLDVAPVVALSHLLPLREKDWELLASLKPHGRIEQINANWRDGDDGIELASAALQFHELGLTAVDKWPGFEGLTGTLALDATSAQLLLNADKASLNIPVVFSGPIAFDHLAGEINLARDGKGFRVDVPDLTFSNEHAAGKAAGSYMFPGQGRGEIDLRAELVRADVRQVWRYFPHRIAKTQSWLEQGLVAGRSDQTKVRLAGSLDRFPFASHNDGVLDIEADVKDAAIRIGEGWPLLESVDGKFRVKGNRIEVEPTRASAMGADISRTRVYVEDIGSQGVRLLVDGKAYGTAGQFLSFVATSPVRDYTRNATSGMDGEGVATLDLQINLPFEDVTGIAVIGALDVEGEILRLGSGIPDMRDYAARVEFTNNDLSIRTGRAVVLGGKARFGSRQSDKGTQLLRLFGVARADEVAAFLDWPLLRDVRGSAEWDGTLAFDKNGSRLRIESTLVGVSSSLPAPLDKLDPVALPLSLDLRMGRDGSRDIDVRLSKVGSVRMLTAQGQVRRGEIAFGKRASMPRQDGLAAIGSLGILDMDGWHDRIATASSRDATRMSETLDAVDIKLGRCLFGGRVFSDLSMVGKRNGRTWRLALDGPQVDGDLIIATGEQGKPSVDATFRSLALTAREPEMTASRKGNDAGATVEMPPALNVVVDKFEFEEKSLGRLVLLAEPEQDRWLLKQLSLTNPDGDIDVNGAWRLDGGRPHAEYSVAFRARNNGGLLKRLGYGETVVGGSGELSGPVSWLGGPFQPDLPTLNGKLRFQAKDGRFAKLDPGAAQLIGILSLQALPRRITLDFKDVFTPGFSFDTINADVTIREGIASTDNFLMEGVSAHVSMAGKVGMVNETQDLRVHVRPQLSGAAAIAGAAVVNPLVGVATLLVQKALGDPVEQIASRDYRVTGTWGNPHVERIARLPVENN